MRYAWMYADVEQAVRSAMQPARFFAAAAAIGIVAVFCTVYTSAYTVSMDGVPLGPVKEKAAFETIVAQVETAASDVLGYDYTIAGDITYDWTLAEQDVMPSAQSFQEYLLGQVNEITEGAVLTVNGQKFAEAADQATIDQALALIQSQYITADTVSVTLFGSVSLSDGYVSVDGVKDCSTLIGMLTRQTVKQGTYVVRTGDTASAIAQEFGMTEEALQALNPDADLRAEALQAGQLLQIETKTPVLSVKTVDNVTYTEIIPFTTKVIEDSDMYEGDVEILIEGVDGARRMNADVAYLNGEEQSRTILEEQWLTEQTEQVIKVGTKERPAWYPTGMYIWPVIGKVTSPFGSRAIFGESGFHSGMDIATSAGSPIYAADGGTVSFADFDGTYGNIVIVDHDNGEQTCYAHCDTMLVQVGDHVFQGQQIATVGTTGRTTGAHCHFELRIDGAAVDPAEYLQQE